MRRMITLLCAILTMTMFLVPTFAAGIETSVDTGVETGVAGEISSSDNHGLGEYGDPEALLGIKDGDYSIDSIGERLQSKGMDIVYLLKIVGQYVCLGAFIVCCILIIIGIVGNARILSKAVIGAIVAGVAYAAITCGEQIVQFIAAWAAS